MATYSLSGSGTHALTASTTGLQVTITTPSSIGGLGRSNPVAKYDQGLIRFSDGTSYWPPVAILGGPQFIPVPANATSFGYALLGGAAISVVEVIGGTLFFSAGASSLASLSDVTLASLADGQVLEWNAAAGKWGNVTLSPGAPASPVFKYTKIDGTGDKSTGSATFVVVDNTNLPPLSLTLAINDVVRSTFMAHCRNSGANQGVALDFNVTQPDASVVRADAGSTVGPGYIQDYTAGGVGLLSVVALFKATQAGTHSFQPVFCGVNGGTATIHNPSAAGPNKATILHIAEKLGPAS